MPSFIGNGVTVAFFLATNVTDPGNKGTEHSRIWVPRPQPSINSGGAFHYRFEIRHKPQMPRLGEGPTSLRPLKA